MMQTLKPTVFFGSGPVAAESLAKLVVWHPIAVVVTKRTPPHHKDVAPVETYAQQNNIPLVYADTKQELDTLVATQQVPHTDYGIVIDYGVIISEQTIQYFTLGIINSHFSILPEWRGADPITYSLLSGQYTTGVSLMLIDKGLDTGPLLAMKHCPISGSDTNASLTTKLIETSDYLLQESLPKYAAGTIRPEPQPNGVVTYSQKLTKQSGVLSADRTATELARQVRAFDGWPNSRLEYNNLWLTITQATASDYPAPKSTLTIHDGKLYFGCKNGSLEISMLQPAGKNKMSASAFINGYAHTLSIASI